MSKTATATFTEETDTATFIVDSKAYPKLKVKVTRNGYDGYSVYVMDGENQVVDVLNVDDSELY